MTGRASALPAGLAMLALAGTAAGQLVLDGSLGPQGAIVPVANEYHVTDDHGVFSAGGQNRYHSFSQFDLPSSNQAAVFNSLQSPQRVIVRVTAPSFAGGSFIAGTLRSVIPGADLFFLNPFGIIFRSTTRFEVMGSFHASTADVLRFADGLDLPTAEAVAPPMLSVAAPTAFGFTGDAPALISLNRADSVSVPEGETLSFVAGAFELTSQSTIEANVRAPGVTVQIAAASGAVDIPLDLASLDPGALPPAPDDGALPGGIQIRSSAVVDVSSPLDGSVPAGRIVIRGGRFVLDDAAVVAVQRSDAADAQGPIDIGVNGAIEIREGGLVVSGSESARAGPEIRLAAPLVEVRDGGRVASEARDRGAGGAIQIEAEALRISNARNAIEGSFVSTNTLGPVEGGPGGDLALRVGKLELAAGGQLLAHTEGSGDAGRLGVEADSIRLSGVDSQGRPSGITGRALADATGGGGDIFLEARSIEVENGAQVSAATFGAGSAGNLEIVASESVAVRGGQEGASLVSAASRLPAGQPARPLGQSGDLTIRPPDGSARALRVVLADGGQVSVSTAGNLAAGDISIRANTVSISGRDPRVGNSSGVFGQSNSFAAAAGAAGNISIEARQQVSIRNGGRVSVLSRGGGDAGRIEIDAGSRLELAQGSITTEALQASGGKVELRAADVVALRDARISTSVLDGTGGGGDVTVDPRFVVLQRSEIVAQAFAGPGGNIQISAGTFLASPDSVVDASSDLGIDGQVEIDAGNTELTGKLAGLPETFLDASRLLADVCAARTARVGSFVVRRRGALPPPDAPLSLESEETGSEGLDCPLAEETP